MSIKLVAIVVVAVAVVVLMFFLGKAADGANKDEVGKGE